MIPTLTIAVPKPISAVRIMPDALGDVISTARAAAANAAQQSAGMTSAMEAMRSAAAKLQASHDSASQKS